MNKNLTPEEELNQEQSEKKINLSHERHFFDPVLASQIGVHEAILVQHFIHWIKINKRANRNFINGRTWTYQKIEEIANHFDYLSKKQIEKLLNKLIKNKILIKMNYNKVKFDRTLWYAFNDESIFLNGEIDFPKWGNGNPQKGRPIPDRETDRETNKENNTKEKTADKSAIGSKEPLSYQINISEKEKGELLKLMNNEELEYWKEQILTHLLSIGKPKKYKSHYAVIRNWFNKEKKKQELYKKIKPIKKETSQEELNKINHGFRKYESWRERIEGRDQYYANQPSFYIKNNKFVIYGNENYEYNLTLENLKKLVKKCNCAPYIIEEINNL